MLTAKDIMSRELITATQETDVRRAAEIMLEKKINGLPVVEGEDLVGIITQSDLVAQQKEISIPSLFTVLDGFIPLSSTAKLEEEMEKIAALTVGQAMTKKVVTVSPDEKLDRIAAIMVDRKLHTLPVVDGKKLVGVIGKEDVLRTLMGGE